MSSAKLPNELLELIVTFVHDKSDGPTPLSQSTLSSLCRASKRFLPLARSCLYHRPISPTSTVTWERALALFASLSSATGRLVVSLEGIVDYVAEIGTLKEPPFHPLPFQLRGETKAFSLYHAILKACPQLALVELIFDSSRHLTKLLDALSKSHLTLKTVGIVNSDFSNTYRVSCDLACLAMSHEQLGGIRNVVLRNVHKWPEAHRSDPAGDLPLESLELVDEHRALVVRKQLFPRDPSRLRSFSLNLGLLSPYSSRWVLKYLPDSLQTLSICVKRLHRPNLADYNPTDQSSLDPSNFAHLTSLTRLFLRGCHGPSVALLDTLASSSPTLSELDFKFSRWVPFLASTSSFSSSSHSRSIAAVRSNPFDPVEGLRRLSQFTYLRRMHLGYLPTTDRETYAELVETLEARTVGGRRVEVEWDPCEE
ncbi:hypothetical protein JCM11491_000632 [Sporobolomyces phaffii]